MFFLYIVKSGKYSKDFYHNYGDALDAVNAQSEIVIIRSLPEMLGNIQSDLKSIKEDISKLNS